MNVQNNYTFNILATFIYTLLQNFFKISIQWCHFDSKLRMYFRENLNSNVMTYFLWQPQPFLLLNHAPTECYINELCSKFRHRYNVTVHKKTENFL